MMRPAARRRWWMWKPVMRGNPQNEHGGEEGVRRIEVGGRPRAGGIAEGVVGVMTAGLRR